MSDTQHLRVVCPFADETSHVGYQTRRAIDMPRRRVVQAEKTMLGLVFEACIALVVECCVFGIWHCIVDQATGVGCEEILREASSSRSANSQVTQSPHAIPAAKAPLGCALCPVTSSSQNSHIHSNPSSNLRSGSSAKIHPLFDPSFWHRCAVVSRGKFAVGGSKSGVGGNAL